jgi:hypothetical protein
MLAEPAAQCVGNAPGVPGSLLASIAHEDAHLGTASSEMNDEWINPVGPREEPSLLSQIGEQTQTLWALFLNDLERLHLCNPVTSLPDASGQFDEITLSTKVRE